MKKTLLKTLALIMVAVMIIPLACSCSDASKFKRLEESEQALELYEIFNGYFEGEKDDIESVTIDISSEMKLSVMEYPVSAEISGNLIYTYDKDGELTAHHSETKTKTLMEMNGKTEESVTKVIEGYQDGKMYINETEDEEEIKYASALTVKEYKEYRDDMESGMDIELTKDNHATRSCVKNDDKSWTATYTDFTAEAVDDLVESFGGGALFGDEYKMEDIKLVIKADKKLVPISMEMVFEIKAEEGVDPAEFWVKAEVVKLNESSVPKLSLDKYTDIGDLRGYKLAENELNDIMNRNPGYFKLVSGWELEANNNTQGSEETDKGEYGLDADGNVFYNINAKTEKDEYTVKYGEGKQKVYRNDIEISNTNMSSLEASSYLESLLNPVEIVLEDMASITRTTEGEKEIYTFKFNSDYKKDEFKDLVDSLGGTSLTSSECTMVLTFKDGELLQRDYTAKMQMAVISGGQYFEATYTTTNKCTFSTSAIS